MEKVYFYDGFLWGGVFDSYQIEKMNDRTNWDEWQKKGKIKDGTTLKIIEKFQKNLFSETFEISKNIGLNSLMFSIEWAKIYPEMGYINRAKLESYKNFILSLKKEGIEIFLILNHFTFPIWFEEKGGFQNDENLKFLISYTEEIVNEFKDIVDYYIPFYEPLKYIDYAYKKGLYPPGISDEKISEIVKENIIKVYKELYLLIHKNNIYSKVGIIKNTNYDNTFFNVLKNYMDFLGITFYDDKTSGLPRTVQKDDIGNNIYPEKLNIEIPELKKYDKPIVISSIGIADESDIYRSQFLIKTISYIHELLNNNIKIMGYFHKNIFDLFEWEEGFSAEYGLFEFDSINNRINPRHSAKVFSNIVQSNKIPPHLIKYTQ
ncbi:hypothetical protein XO10_02325 [Marinitoga sp. 1135]|uniref:family 1 glycosylhydrolase n=1 Tax=unclassified Marinitoga TaxID=2640159 RepID=UPI000950908D|nr:MULTISPECIES: family 1 glycosylhydrolase [unclassified Marinitoga]APT75396.1 hypothetical protein LN42_02595 [Marinitoga sp. 1137]NUU95128.1 hypothetical protein [Marinitoga sp. 1135]NUU97060.1 hypothetical protein [Marinitoga sp. 1138]